MPRRNTGTNTMRVLYDHQTFSLQRFGGISIYYAELLKIYSREGTISPLLGVGETNNAYVQGLKAYEEGPYRVGRAYARALRFGSKIAREDLLYWKNQKISSDAVRSGEYDVFHPTYYDPYFLEHLGGKPFVLVVHDMIHEIYPEFWVGNKTFQWKRKLVENASRIVAVSANTKNDLVGFYDIDPERVTVIRQGNSLGPIQPNSSIKLEQLNGMPSRFMLFVGARGAYKNFYTFVEAIAPLLKKDDDLCLVCLGGGIFTEDESRFLSTLGILGKVRYMNYQDDLARHLYAHALVYVIPSTYEGFGLQIVEALTCGCPIASSERGSLPEIGGDVPVYFDPKSFRSIREAVERVIGDDHLRETMRRKGLERGPMFSWEKNAKELKAVYESLV